MVNNAIVLVDAINRRRRRGEPLDGAILGGGRERLRPILMTAATTVPEGAEERLVEELENLLKEDA